MNRFITEKMQIVMGIVPINLASGANNGDWVSLKNYGRCAVVLIKGAGAAGEDPTLTLVQATEVAGTTSKSLTFTRIDKKVGGQTTISQFTTVTQAAAATYLDDTTAENELIMIADIKAEDLDVANGYDCLRATIADVGTTSQIGGLIYILHEPRYASPTLPGAITD